MSALTTDMSERVCLAVHSSQRPITLLGGGASAPAKRLQWRARGSIILLVVHSILRLSSTAVTTTGARLAVIPLPLPARYCVSVGCSILGSPQVKEAGGPARQRDATAHPKNSACAGQ